MSGFRFPVPEAIWPVLLKNNIRTEQDLINYVEKHPLRYDIGKYYSFSSFIESKIFSVDTNQKNQFSSNKYKSSKAYKDMMHYKIIYILRCKMTSKSKKKLLGNF